MKLVRQKHPDGCGVAVFAMLQGITYDRAARELDFAPGDGGLHWPKLRRELERRGRFCRVVDNREDTGGAWPPRPFAPQSFALVHQNDTGTAHFLALDALGRVYDPLTPRGQKPGILPLACWRIVQEVVGVL